MNLYKVKIKIISITGQVHTEYLYAVGKTAKSARRKALTIVNRAKKSNPDIYNAFISTIKLDRKEIVL